LKVSVDHLILRGVLRRNDIAAGVNLRQLRKVYFVVACNNVLGDIDDHFALFGGHLTVCLGSRGFLGVLLLPIGKLRGLVLELARDLLLSLSLFHLFLDIEDVCLAWLSLLILLELLELLPLNTFLLLEEGPFTVGNLVVHIFYAVSSAG
jgi:hypothetical protein